MSNSDIPWHQNAGFYSNPNTELTVVYNTDELVKQHSYSALHAGKIFSSVHLHEADRRIFPSHSSSKASLWLWSSFLCSFSCFFKLLTFVLNSKDTNRKNVFIFAQTECLQTCHPCPMCVNNHHMIHPLKRRRTFLSSQQHLKNNVPLIN